MVTKNIVKSNKFIKDHDFSITPSNQAEFRKFQIHKSLIKEEYKKSKYIDLPVSLGGDLIKFKNIQIDPSIEPKVRVIIGKRLVHTIRGLKMRDPEKWKALKNESIKNDSWTWKKMTAIVSIKPVFNFKVHIFDAKKNRKIEEISGFSIGFKAMFRILETLEISFAKHFKTSFNIESKKLTEKDRSKFDLKKIVFLKIMRRQFSNTFLLKRGFQESLDIEFEDLYPLEIARTANPVEINTS